MGFLDEHHTQDLTIPPATSSFSLQNPGNTNVDIRVDCNCGPSSFLLAYTAVVTLVAAFLAYKMFYKTDDVPNAQKNAVRAHVQ